MRQPLPVDQRGYVGAEKNRELSPEQVIWARGEYFDGRVTPRQLAMMWNMGIESVRRMLRGDTYANVGQALPRAEVANRAVEAVDEKAEEALRILEERGMVDLGGLPKVPTVSGVGEVASGEDAIDLFLQEGEKKGA